MYEELLSDVVKILVSLLAIAGTYLVAKVKSYLAKRLSAHGMDILDKLIKDFCEAAEQQYKLSDPDGSIRYTYVQELLVEAGYDITDVIKAKIESTVYNINREVKP